MYNCFPNNFLKIFLQILYWKYMIITVSKKFILKKIKSILKKSKNQSIFKAYFGEFEAYSQ